MTTQDTENQAGGSADVADQNQTAAGSQLEGGIANSTVNVGAVGNGTDASASTAQGSEDPNTSSTSSASNPSPSPTDTVNSTTTTQEPTDLSGASTTTGNPAPASNALPGKFIPANPPLEQGGAVGETTAASTETNSAEVKAAADEQAAITQEGDEAAQDPVKLHGHSLVEANAHLLEPTQYRNKLMQLLHDVVSDADRAEHWTVEELLKLAADFREKL